jgi:hypothetical protein
MSEPGRAMNPGGLVIGSEWADDQDARNCDEHNEQRHFDDMTDFHPTNFGAQGSMLNVPM